MPHSRRFYKEACVAKKSCRDMSYRQLTCSGRKMIQDRLLCFFFWAGLYSDVAELCRSCPEYQRTARYKKHQAPLNSLPLIDQPFARVVIDLVSPFDYATWYPEAKPLKLTNIETIARLFMIIFCRVRVPKEFLSDCGASLTIISKPIAWWNASTPP